MLVQSMDFSIVSTYFGLADTGGSHDGDDIALRLRHECVLDVTEVSEHAHRDLLRIYSTKYWLMERGVAGMDTRMDTGLGT